MSSVLVIGGTGFVGRHTVHHLLGHDYGVTVGSRGEVSSPFEHTGAVSTLNVDRTDPVQLAAVADRVDPDIVIDCALFDPEAARAAIEIFGEVDAYVYVSSGGVYRAEEIPKREDSTPLHECSPDQARDDSMATYGPRKAECDRIVRGAASQGVDAMSVRPTMIYGPKTVESESPPAARPPSWAGDAPAIQTHHDYWIDRIDRYDRVVVPGDGTAIWHRAYVEDVAEALRIVAEDGVPGEAYNVADQRVCTMEDVIDLIANSLHTDVEVVPASRRELAQVDLDPDDFVLYHHLGSNYPHVLDSCKLASLGWDSTDPAVAMDRTVEESLASDRTGGAFDPGRDAEERFLETVAA